eukprot:15042802-Ditylum_brightwellii.AAC.1
MRLTDGLCFGQFVICGQQQLCLPSTPITTDTNDFAIEAFFQAMKTWVDKLCVIALPRGYFPEPDKSILVARKANLGKAKELFKGYKFKLKEGFRYLGGFIGSADLAQKYVQEKVEGWVNSVKIFAQIMLNQPQVAFTGYACSIQFKRAYIQRAIKVEE